MGALYRMKNLAWIVGTIPGIDGDQITHEGTVSNGNQVIYTVPVGHLFLLSTSAFNGESSSPGTYVYYRLFSAAGSPKFFFGIIGEKVAGSISVSHSFSFPLECEAGTYFKIVSSGANAVGYGSLWGILVSADRGVL